MKRRKNDNLMPLLIAVLIVLLVVVGLVSGAALKNYNNIADLTDTLEGDAFAQCGRVQRAREGDNARGAVIFVVLSASPVKDKPFYLGGKRFTLRQLGDAQTYDPPTDCVAAVKAGRRYVRPKPQPFTVDRALKALNKVRIHAGN